MVICVPAIAVLGVTLVMFGVLTVRFTVFDHTPPCSTCATPVFEPEATFATICVSLQLTTTPYVLPSHTFPLPWLAPKPVPVIVICVDRKSTRLNSSHSQISYAVFCLKKKNRS